MSSTSTENGNIACTHNPRDCRCKWSFHNIPLDVFIERVDNKTIDADIESEFFDAIKDKSQAYIAKLIKRINELSMLFGICNAAIKYINISELASVPRDEEVMKILKEKLGAKNIDSVKLLETKSKAFLAEKQLKETELKRIMPEQTGQPANRKYFSHLLLQVSKHLKYQVNKKETTASEFADMIIDMRETFDQVKKQNNAPRR